MNDLISFSCIVNACEIYQGWRDDVATLSNLYDVSANDLVVQLTKFRARISAFSVKFPDFASMAKYVLTQLSDGEYGILKKMVGILLVLPFCTADCERAFSAMNRIRTAERSKLKCILRELMLAYTASDEEEKKLDIVKMAEKVATEVWKKEGKKTYWDNDFII